GGGGGGGGGGGEAVEFGRGRGGGGGVGGRQRGGGGGMAAPAVGRPPRRLPVEAAHLVLDQRLEPATEAVCRVVDEVPQGGDQLGQHRRGDLLGVIVVQARAARPAGD